MLKFSGCLILLSFFGLRLSAQVADDAAKAPERINYQVRESTVNSVAEDVNWWEARIAASPQNSASWLGLYTAKRYLALRAQGKSFTKQQLAELKDIEANLAEIDANSYEYHRVAFLNRYLRNEGKEHLEQAYSLRPDRAENWEGMASYALFEGRNADLRSFLKKMKDNAAFSSSHLEYHRQLLRGMPANAVLLTHGYSDTWPLLIVQIEENLRKDVQILSVDHLLNMSYREKIMQVLGIPSSTPISSEPYIATEMLPQGIVRPVFVCLSFPDFWLSGHKDQLYFEGLCYRWMPEVKQLVRFNASNYLEKQIKLSAIQPAEPISRNYLPLLSEAYREYRNTGQDAKAEVVKQKALAIAAYLGSPPALISKFE